MTDKLQQDLVLTFAFTNYLNASYQGKFAALNILSQLSYVAPVAEEAARVRDVLTQINRWNTDVWNNIPLFAASWSTPETFESMKAVSLLRELKKELYDLSNELARILAGNIAGNMEDVKLLIASYGRFGYSRDNYIRGFIEFAKTFNMPEAVEQYTAHLPRAAQDVEIAHNLLATFRDAPRVGGEFFDELALRARDLPAVFRTHTHDINQLLATFAPGLSYETADFTREEADEWKSANINPAIAGYWRAYNFTPADVVQWSAVGVNDASLASDWLHEGFNVETAGSWASIGTPPAVAGRWLAAGYAFEEAERFFQEGTYEPPPRRGTRR